MSNNLNGAEEPAESGAERQPAPPTESFAAPELAVAPERPRKSNWLLILLFALLAVVGALLLWRSFDSPPVQDLSTIGAKGYVGSWTDGQQEISFGADGSVKGTDGCNSFFSEWEFRDGRAHVGNIAITEMACFDDSNELIQNWIAQTNSAALKGSMLHFYGADGEELGTMEKGQASARPQTAPDFLGIWKNDLQQIELTQDGRLSGTDGCNTISSSWEEEAGAISFSPIAGTRMACTDPETGDLIRGWFMDAAAATVSDDGLIVIDANGGELGVMVR